MFTCNYRYLHHCTIIYVCMYVFIYIYIYVFVYLFNTHSSSGSLKAMKNCIMMSVTNRISMILGSGHYCSHYDHYY